MLKSTPGANAAFRASGALFIADCKEYLTV
jgi:hypothetical protein